MIRPTTAKDTAAILALANAAIGFEPDEQAELSATLDQYLAGSSAAFWLTDEDQGEIVGAAYCAPEAMTNGTWNLLFIAIHPGHQDKGRGKALMKFVEQRLTAQGDRLLLVETLASFEDTRAFYRHCNYEEEARIRDYYDAGQDKVIYRKQLAA